MCFVSIVVSTHDTGACPVKNACGPRDAQVEAPRSSGDASVSGTSDKPGTPDPVQGSETGVKTSGKSSTPGPVQVPEVEKATVVALPADQVQGGTTTTSLPVTPAIVSIKKVAEEAPVKAASSGNAASGRSNRPCASGLPRSERSTHEKVAAPGKAAPKMAGVRGVEKWESPSRSSTYVKKRTSVDKIRSEHKVCHLPS